MNQVTMVGRLVREIQLQEVGEGKSVVNNTIAVQRIFKTEQQQQADFIPLVAWGKVAKLFDLYCEKGDLIGINGKMQSRSYINSENITIFVVEMRVEEIQFLQNKRTEETIAVVEP
ncbi:single-stranded DNA-binding protein [Carnobacterium maltaromaticum]|uniref:single-stranded DNA-binding protein n=1 Tax=Carnobacterium maltaromaticum TaxID=2751 RepID=UPI000C77FE2B|nr:single-stranded DNA-binding protein [Carnobacterium maltaromaticum]PLS39286.1 single-stranded DNA-binding protein [Carnobacterium maltaromaticum]PLS40095.1 single-stranded DNA-binding protein [Carnobacterium maltaromaticum]PLS40432.1 single-stranded DNA-binding protein [Carnobacterium maltaromaticum]PLS46075.1 single-stranded DNA-binding protein [Carnobacterium maltaromaticum]PLS47227.1 single-stranded DNA-binding protein [Carnobacterium maltaromaticum]